MDHLLSWINNPSRKYQEGVDLFKELGNNTVLLKVFQRGESTFTKKKLYASLKRLLPEETKPVSIPVKHYIPQNRIDPESLPLDLKNLYYNDYIRSMQTRSALHHELRYEESEKRRGDIALEILDIDDHITDLFDQLLYFQKNGKRKPKSSSEVEIEDIKNPFKLQDLERNYRSYVTRYKDRPEMKKKYEALLTRVQAQIEVLKVEFENLS